MQKLFITFLALAISVVVANSVAAVTVAGVVLNVENKAPMAEPFRDILEDSGGLDVAGFEMDVRAIVPDFKQHPL